AARRELDQTRTRAQDRRGTHRPARDARQRSRGHRGAGQRRGPAANTHGGGIRERHRPPERQRTAARDLRRALSAEAHEPARPGHTSADRDPRDARAGSRVRLVPMADIRALVVDDEQLAREELCFLLGETGIVDISGQASDGVVALRLAGELKPDVVFLDVQMPGLTGFEVARRLLLTDSPPELVFVTAYDQHAIDAFSVNAVDYVLKPVDSTRLAQTLERLRSRLASRAGASKLASPLSPADLEKVIEAVQARQGRREQIAIRTGEKFTLVQAEELVHASLVDESIVVATQTMYGTSNYRTLDELQARLDPAVFWRVHRSHLVNITKIKEIVPWFSRNYLLKMKDPKTTETPVSRAQTKRLREYLQI